VSKKFKPVGYDNIERMCNTGVLVKGALLKYRWTANTILSYDLEPFEASDWFYGVVTEIMWYIAKPSMYALDSKDMLCHEIGVRETSDNKYRLIDLQHFEVLVLSE
jgi:hypothetical protein